MNSEKLKLIEPQTKTYWLSFIIALLLLVLTLITWWKIKNDENERYHQRIEIETKKISSLIEKDFKSRILALNRMSSRWEISNGTSKKEFYEDARHYVIDMPGIQSIQWVDNTYHVKRIIPLAGNEQTLGINIAFEEKQKNILKRSKENKLSFISLPVDLVQEGKGFFIYFPLFINNKTKFDGFLVAVFKIDKWIEHVLKTRESTEQFKHFRIAASYSNERVYAQSGFDLIPNSDSDSKTSFFIGGHRYNVYCHPTKDFFKDRKSLFAEFIAFGGILMSSLVSFSIFLFLKSNNEMWKNNIIKRELENEILERKSVENNLKEISTRLELATKAGEVGIWSWNILEDKLFWNETMFKLYEFPPDIIPNFNLWKNSLFEADAEKTLKKLNDAVEGKTTFDTEFRIKINDEIIKTLHTSAKLERDSSGNPKKMIGVNWDITELKNIEKELKKQTELQEILMNISTKYINVSLHELDNAINNALEEIGLYVSADRVYVFRYDLKKYTTTNIYEWCHDDIQPQIQNLEEVPLEAIPDWIKMHKKGQAMLVPNVSKLPEGDLKELLSSQDIKTLIAVPMESEDNLIGFVGFDWVKDYYSYSNNELNLLNLFSQILVNIQLRQLSEKTVIESKERLDLAIKGTNAGLWDWYIQKGEVTFNERWAEIVGYSLSELEPINIETWMNLCHPDDLKDSNEALQNHFNGKTDFYEFEARMKHKNGQWVWILDRGQVVEWSNKGEPVRMTGTHVDITEKKIAEEKIKHMANHDALTDLPTMRLAIDRAYIANKRATRNHSIAAYMFIDLDGFKSINDNYGHNYGDELLKEVANRLTECVRKYDTVARIGGDEFLIILNDFKEKKDLIEMSKKLIQKISKAFLIKGETMHVGASIGISIYPKDGENVDDLIKKADIAMYKIKKSGKNNYAFSLDE